MRRAADLLQLVASLGEADRTASGLAAALGKPLPTTYHLLQTLVDTHLLVRDQQLRYHLGTAVGRLVSAYQAQSHVPTSLLLPLQALAGETGESCYFSAWRFGEIEVLASVSGSKSVRVTDLSPGFYGCAHARASGKVLLAFTSKEERERYLATHELTAVTPSTITVRGTLDAVLEQVAGDGYGSELEEFRLGVACLSMPIFDGRFLIGTYTVSWPHYRYEEERDVYMSALQRATDSAQASLTRGASGTN